MRSAGTNGRTLLSQRVGPLVAIVLLHIGFFYALQNGLQIPSASATRTAPKTVYVSFITPEQPKPVEAPKPPPPKPKPVPEKKPVKKTPLRPVPKPPSEKAITAPPEPPPAPEPPAPQEPVTAAAPALPAAPAPAPAPAAPAAPRLLSSGIQYVKPPEPQYPPFSRRMREEGKVVMRVLVNENGRAERAEIQSSSGYPRLDEAAIRAAMRAVFKPHIENGRPVAVYALIPINFQLDS